MLCLSLIACSSEGINYKSIIYKVRNLNIDLATVGQIIGQVLVAKEERVRLDICEKKKKVFGFQQGCESRKMGDFLCEFAAFKYSSEPLQMEFTYNFSAGLDRYRFFIQNMKARHFVNFD